MNIHEDLVHFSVVENPRKYTITIPLVFKCNQSTTDAMNNLKTYEKLKDN